MSDKTGNLVLAFFGLDTGANIEATLGWVLPILVLPILGLAGMSYGLSLFIELPLMGHLAAIGGAAIIAFFTLARIRVTFVEQKPEDQPGE